MPCSFQLLRTACARLGHDVLQVMDVLSEHFSSVQLFKLPPFNVVKLMCAQRGTAQRRWRCATYKLVATLS